MEAILTGANGKDVPRHVVAGVMPVLGLVPIRSRLMAELLVMDWEKLPKLENATLMLVLLVSLKS